MASFIHFSEKASNACVTCRIRKQKCDRALPKCSRCAAKLRPCDYTAHTYCSSHPYGRQPVEALVQRHPSGYDLSWRGSIELLQAMQEIHDASFIKLVYYILDLMDVTLPTLLQQYLIGIRPWLPVIPEDQLRERCFVMPEAPKPLSPLLLLVLLLVTRRPCGPKDQPTRSILYKTLKQLMTIVQPKADSACDLLQCNLLVALYECGQGLTDEAFLTLSSSIALEKLRSSCTREERSIEVDGRHDAHYANIISILDGTISWSSLDHQIPLISPSNETTNTDLRIGPPSPAQNTLNSSDDALMKLQLTSQVAVISGRALQYVYDTKRGDTLLREYDVLAREMGNMVSRLMKEHGNHSWTFCDSIAMGLSCLLALHQAEVQQVKALEHSKEYLALLSARRMAWDMCKASMDMIKPDNVWHLSFVGMCHVFRAAVAVLESPGQDVTAEELEELLPTLRWFSERWAVGVEYLNRIESYIKTG